MAVQMASDDPEAGLRAVAALRRLLERVEGVHVEAERKVVAGDRRRARRLETSRAQEVREGPPEVRPLAPKPSRAASALFARACSEAADLSFAVGVEHLVLACAIDGALDVDPEEIRDRIVADERDALASIGISLDIVRSELEDRLRTSRLPISPEAKRMLEIAARRRRHVTAEQLLQTLEEHSASARRLLGDLRR